MSSGSYFVQVISPNYLLGNVAFEFDVRAAQNSKCKAYDFDIPIAQFELLGGCNNDTIQTKNISTQGEDVSHYWHLNGNFWDSSLNISLFESQDEILLNNNIKLVVVNNETGEKDSTTQVYIKDTTEYYLYISDPGNPKCGDTIQLSVNTNYNHKLNFEWSGGIRTDNKYSENPKVTPIYSTPIYVSATSDNCHFKDTIELEIKPGSNIFKDTSLCGSELTLSYNLDGIYSFYVNGEYLNVNPWEPTGAGQYNISFYNSNNGCNVRDTITIDTGRNIITSIEKDTLSLCNERPLTLKYSGKLLDYEWNTASKEDSIIVTQEGDYWLKGSQIGCKKLEYYVNVIKDSVPEIFLRDTTICENEIYHFINPTPFNVTEKSPNFDSFSAVTTTPLFMTLEKNGCSTTDTALLTVTPSPNLSFIEEYCFDSDSVQLDAQEAYSYNWLGYTNTSRFLYANQYKTYTVSRGNLNGCIDTFSYEIRQNCALKIFIPNAFTPNGDQLNKSYRPIIIGDYENFTMQIFNRWGELLYETYDGTPWTGFYKGVRVQQDAYFAIITVESKDPQNNYDNRVDRFSTTITVLY